VTDRFGELRAYDPWGGTGTYRPVGTMVPEAAAGPVWTFRAADGTHAEVAVLAADLARVRLLPPGVRPAHSWSVARHDWPELPVERDERPNGLGLTTGAMTIDVGLSPFRVAFQWPDGEPFAEDDPEHGMGTAGGAVRCHKRLPPGERVLGAGERIDPLDKRGHKLTFFNVDPPQWPNPQTDNMYVNIPFWMGLRDGRAYGILLDTTWQGTLDAGATQAEQLVFGAAGGELTYYVFAGPTPADVLARYADLTGHIPLPPRWAIGYQQSRWSYFPQDHLRDVAREFRARGIPCDVLYLDIDYMDGYRDFTWAPERFPDPAGVLRELRDLGFQVVTIVDPGIKPDPTDPTYAEGLERGYFVRMPDGALFTGSVWPGECVFPDFSRVEVRHWWGERHRALLGPGVAGIWDDMNEPSLTTTLTPGRAVGHGTIDPEALHQAGGEDGPPLRHAAFHNAYGLEMARATREGLERLQPDRRAFVLNRSGTAGIQRYAATWTGDNGSTWEHLRLAVRMCLGMGLSGQPFVGADIGGFWGDATAELLTRFTQVGALMPLCRNHSELYSRKQEPWVFGQPYEAICRAAIELRYRLLPYLYTCFEQAAAEGAPIMRALAFAFPEDVTASALDDEFLLGDALLAAPVLEERMSSRSAYFPDGSWVDLRSGERIVGPTTRQVVAPLDVLPLYAREGAIVPFGPLLQYVDERPTDPLTLAIYLGGPGAHAEGQLYEDDGRTHAYQHGAVRLTRFDASHLEDQVNVRVEEPDGGYDPGTHTWIVELHLATRAPRVHWTPRAVRVGQQELARGEAPRPGSKPEQGEYPAWSTIERRYETVVRVALGRQAAPFALTVELG
jgi:alpha-glucosidase